MAWAPVLAANLRTARWPYVLDEITQTSFGFSTAAMIRAARTSFSQVFPMLIMWIPRQRVHVEAPLSGYPDRRTIGISSFPDIRLHLFIAVFTANVALSSQQELDLLVGRAQNGGEF
jgi:hypothetical protein